MSEWVLVNLQWFKALHVIAVIAWMAGMLYLPRLFVYHADAEIGSVQSETFKVMEFKLYRMIITPAMLAAWIFGLIMVAAGAVDWSSGWPWVKGAFVILMSAVHGMFGTWRRKFAEDRNDKPAKFYRMVNEVPMLFIIVIVIMVIVKPF